LHIRHLHLTNFRNFRLAELALSPGQLLFIGDNAQGKSNLLEAVYLLASGRSPRAGTDSEVIGWAAESEVQPFARLEAEVGRRGGRVLVEAVVAGPAPAPAGSGRGGKRFRVNGIPRRITDFVGQLRAVLFTADDLDIVSGPPASRRAYLDAAISQADRSYYAALQRYARLMQQRNATLRRIKEGVAGPDELSLWDEGFAREGGAIIAARRDAVAALGRRAATAHADLSGSAGERLEIAYEPQLGDEWRGLLAPDAPTDQVRSLLAAALASQRRRETAAGVSLVGPHRDELRIALNGVSAAAFASRAQIRTVALSLRLAEAGLLRAIDGDPPVLLLDDIVSELDESRRRSVLRGLEGFDQVWFTATTGAGLPPDFVAACAVYRVRSGHVEPA